MAMSDSDSTQSWNEEEENGLPSNEAFNDALASLEEHLQEHDDPVLYDEEQEKADMYEDGVEYASELDASGDPVDASYIDQAENSDLYDSHEPEQDELALSEELSDDEIIDEQIIETGADFDDQSEELEIAEDDFEDDLNEEIHAEAVDHDSVDEAYEIASYEDMDDEPEAAPAEASHDSALSIGGNGNEGADDFNLATLTQLVDEIRQESQRVAEMKASVSEALSLIQEMSESLKS